MIRARLAIAVALLWSTAAAKWNRALFALLASFVVGSALGESPEPAKVRITTWNLEWFPNGFAHDATPEVQAQRSAAAQTFSRRARDLKSA